MNSKSKKVHCPRKNHPYILQVLPELTSFPEERHHVNMLLNEDDNVESER